MLFSFWIMGVESEEEMNKTPYHSIYDARCTMTIPIILSATVLSDRDDTGCPALWFVRFTLSYNQIQILTLQSDPIVFVNNFVM